MSKTMRSFIRGMGGLLEAWGGRAEVLRKAKLAPRCLREPWARFLENGQPADGNASGGRNPAFRRRRDESRRGTKCRFVDTRTLAATLLRGKDAASVRVSTIDETSGKKLSIR